MKKSEMRRREFLKGAAGAAAVATVVPRCAVARSGENPPSEKLNIAGIGIGGMGGGDIDAVAGGNNIVALCDVDMNYAPAPSAAIPRRSSFTTFVRCLTRWTSRSTPWWWARRTTITRSHPSPR